MRDGLTPCVDHGRKGFGLGYATAWITKDGKRFTTTLHRKLYYEATGEWPQDVRHKCDNARCINLAHLEGGTRVDNMRDMYERGRAGDTANYGTNNGRCVLSDRACKAIRLAYVKGSRQYGCSALAKQYGVGTSQIWRVVNGHQRNAEAEPRADARLESAAA